MPEAGQGQDRDSVGLSTWLLSLQLTYMPYTCGVSQGLIVRRPRFKHNPLARVVSVALTVLLWPLAKLADLLVWSKVGRPKAPHSIPPPLRTCPPACTLVPDACTVKPGSAISLVPARLCLVGQVRVALGGKAKLVVSGGSALAKYLEDFYQAAGIKARQKRGPGVAAALEHDTSLTDALGLLCLQVVSGYGLTETSPVIAVRRADRNLVDGGVVRERDTLQLGRRLPPACMHGCLGPTSPPALRLQARGDGWWRLCVCVQVGMPPSLVELRVVDPDTGKEAKAGRPGVVLTRGPQVLTTWRCILLLEVTWPG